MENNTNEYANSSIKVSYDPKKCTHAGACCAGLSDVFRSSVIPWIDMDGAPTEKIIAQVGKCPSGALSYTRKLQLVNSK